MINTWGIIGFSILLIFFCNFEILLEAKCRFFPFLASENHQETTECLPDSMNLTENSANYFNTPGEINEARGNYQEAIKDSILPFKIVADNFPHHGGGMERIIWKMPICRLQGDSEIPFGAIFICREFSFFIN